MSNTVNKSDLAATVAEATGVSKSKADEILTRAFAEITSEVEAGNAVSLAGFGKFYEKDRPARAGRNPRTGETIQIAASRSMKFRPFKAKAA